MMSRQPPSWVRQYVGLEYENRGRGPSDGDRGYDCWGLVREVLRKELGILLPSYKVLYNDSAAAMENGKAVSAELPRFAMCKVPYAEAAICDVALLRARGWPAHVGVMVARGTMLHIEKNLNAVVERLDGLRWQNNVIGIYRPASYLPQASTANQ